MADIGRRAVIRGFFGLAALAVAPGTLQALPLSDQERLAAQLQRGTVIQNQTFVLDGPVCFNDMAGLKLKECRFIWPNGLKSGDTMLFFDGLCDDIEISNCTFVNGSVRFPWPSDYVMAAHWGSLAA